MNKIFNPLKNVDKFILIIVALLGILSLVMLESTVDEIWDASSAIDDIVSHYKGHYITFKKYHETGHMLTVAYQPNHRYRKDWRLLMKESEDFWLATIHFFYRHLKKQ